VRASIAGGTKEQIVVVTAGDRHRVVGLTFAPDGVRCGQSGAPPAAQSPERAETKPIPPLVYVFGGLGLASLGVATGFGVSAWSQKGTLDDCRGHCTTSDVDTMERTFIVADIATVVAALSVVAAGYFYFTR
jgi:hypothetical protein